jgi:tryptophan synthase alpha chain
VPEEATRNAVDFLKSHTDLPLAVGFGIKTPEMVATIVRTADAAVVGSAIVERIVAGLDNDDRAQPGMVGNVLEFVNELATGVRKK